MRIGIVAYWFNRGQGVVARQLRSALEGLGHETFVLARPTRETNIRPSWIDREGIWDQPGVTAASAFEVPWAEYEAWSEAEALELVLFDQNYQFEEIGRLRRSGVRTIGRFVWEQFSPSDVDPAGDAFDAIYSLTACERERYAGLGIDSPRVRWGIHPELLAYAPDLEPSEPNPAGDRGTPGRESEREPIPHPGTDPAGADARAEKEIRDGRRPERKRDLGGSGAAGGSELVKFFFPGGFMSRRKPFEDVLSAFRETDDARLRLVLKAQVERHVKRVRKLSGRDSRIEVIWEEIPTADYLRLFACADVCLAPSRWEGLGLHLYEATGFGVPILTNDNPPMNEIVEDGVNGLLVRGVPDGRAPSGITAYRPDPGELRAAIERLADAELRAELAAGAAAARERLRWATTVADLDRLIGAVAGAATPT